MHSRLERSVQHKRNHFFPQRAYKELRLCHVCKDTKLNCIASSLAPAARGDSAGGSLAREPSVALAQPQQTAKTVGNKSKASERLAAVGPTQLPSPGWGKLRGAGGPASKGSRTQQGPAGMGQGGSGCPSAEERGRTAILPL